MRVHEKLGVDFWLLAGLGGLVLTCTQACADGKSKTGTGDTMVTGGTGSGQGGAINGGNTGQGGSPANAGNSSTGGSAITNTGGINNSTGGSGDGGYFTTGGEVANTGGTGAGGDSSTGTAGGDSGGTGGSASNTGGTNTGGTATGGTAGVSCQTSLDCVNAPNNQTICDGSVGSCVQCVSAADCGTNFDCIVKKCISFDPCSSSTDCPNNKACDTDKGRCVECTVDSDCSSGQKCMAQSCRIGCNSDNSCTSSGMLCNTTLGACVQCNAQLKCGAGLVCDSTGLCVPPVCKPGERICASDGGTATCKSDGSGFGTSMPCPANSSCKAGSSPAACYGNSVDGGFVDNCAVGGDPCQQISQFAGTQTLDGVGDEFCAIPGLQFSAKNAAKSIVYNATAPEVAMVRVAWSAEGLHAFIDVQDASVQTVNAVDPSQAISKVYQGDSIELMISSSNSITGLTGTDSNTLQVIVPASGPAVSGKTSNVNGSSQGTLVALASSEYAQKITPTGYAIELNLPWPGNNSPAAGATVRFDISLNSADKTFGSVDDMRDGQLIYYLGTVSGTTTCQGTPDGTVPFCDDRTWCSTPLL